MQYKDKGDIDFTKYRDFAETIKDLEPDEIILETMMTWYPKKKYSADLLAKFAKAVTKKAPFRYRLDFDFQADRFIDTDTFFTENERLELAKLVIRKRWFWQRIKYTLNDVEYAVNKFAEFVAPIKDMHEWIYNPPIVVSDRTLQTFNSARSEYQQEFVEHYGAYMEMVYLLCDGDATKQDEIYKWPVDKFLYWSEYLLRKRIIENV